MISVPFYLFYFLISIISPLLIFSKKSKKYVIPVLVFTPHFNVTALLKVGLTISFFELALLLTTISIILINKKSLLLFKPNNIDKIYLTFLYSAIISIFFGWIRIQFCDLKPDPYMDNNPSIRSIMSLNRLFVYLPCLIIIRGYLLLHFSKEEINNIFLKSMAYSGILPCLAGLLQMPPLGFYIFHNNPSFSENNRPEIFNTGQKRMIALTNEASFFAYQLFFSFMSLFHCNEKKLFTNKKTFILSFFYVTTIILSISRTGLLIFSIYLIYRFLLKSASLKNLIISISILSILVYFSQDINILDFSLKKRFLSIFSVKADISTIERYGSANALVSLGLDKSKIVGIGIYNYHYYIKRYLPSYMKGFIYYKRDEPPPSFNFIIQLIVEFGSILFIIWIIISIIKILECHSSYVSEWFLFLFIFATSFQALNFSIPFVICLFNTYKKNENIVFAR